jgi:hypothetical protein
MRQFTVILFLTAVLFTATPLQQLFKLPVLVQHYYEHKQIDKNISIIAFLKLHYVEEEEGADADDKRDQQLPFKSLAHFISPTTNANPIANTYVAVKPEITGKSGLNPVTKTLISSQHLSAIWQPPKGC